MSDDLDQLSALRTRIVRAVREHTGMSETLAVPLTNALIQELQASFGGRYIPAPSKHARDQAIRDAAALGQSIDAICRDFGVHRCTVYRALGQGSERAA